MFLIIVVRAVTMEGAMQGLDAFFKPDWSRIFDGKVWLAAYGQIFFSLSLAFGIMITYSSYLPKNSDTTNNAFITGFANSGFELLAGIGVFAALGFMANNMGVPVDKVASAGVGLAFVVFHKLLMNYRCHRYLVYYFLIINGCWNYVPHFACGSMFCCCI